MSASDGVATFELEVNRRRLTVSARPDAPLLWVLRDTLGQRDVKYGCGLGLCGACTVLEGGHSLRSCRTTIAEAAGRSFTTLAGLAAPHLHPVQQAWLDEDVAQCGYCQGGMILETVALLERSPDPSDDEIDAALYDVLCRCGTYDRVRKAVRRAAALRAGRSRP